MSLPQSETFVSFLLTTEQWKTIKLEFKAFTIQVRSTVQVTSSH